MFNIAKLEEIPMSIRIEIMHLDIPYITQNNITRYYGYVNYEQDDYLFVLVAVKKNRKNNLCLKQVAVHTLNSKKAYAKDINLTMNGYVTGWSDEGISRRKYWENGLWEEVYYKYYHPSNVTWVNRSFFDNIEEFRYSAASKCSFQALPKYLEIYRANPKVELLKKAGLDHLITSAKTTKYLERPDVLKFIRDNMAEIKRVGYRLREIQHAIKHKISLEAARIYITAQTSIRFSSCENWFRNHFRGESAKLTRYLMRQGCDFAYFKDYITACEELHLDLADTKNKYPLDLRYWHDVRTEEVKVLRKKIKEKLSDPLGIEKMAKKYKRLEMNIDGFVFILAKSKDDLIYEGAKLHHCVGHMGYDKKILKEESLILFVRKENDLENPFVTIEYSLSSRKILQEYAKNNTKPSAKVIAAANKWVKKSSRFRFAA